MAGGIVLLLFMLLLSPRSGEAGVVFNDEFTGAAGDLDAHTPDTGTSWTLLFNDVQTMRLDGSGSVGGSAAGNAFRYAYYSADATYDSADYDVEVDFSVVTSVAAGRMVAMLARYQDANNFYVCVIGDPADTNDVRIYKVVAGTATKISSTEDTTPATNDVFLCEVRGNNIGLKKNGAYVINPVAGDAALAAAGKAGWGESDFTGETSFATAGGNMKITSFTVTTVSASTRRPIAPLVFP